MLTDTQISSFLIPTEVWNQGHSACPELPPIVRPAQDALDIERRIRKDVRLPNEAHRYVLCCERIQGIAKELSEAGVLHPPTKFVAFRFADQAPPSAVAYIALIDTIGRGLRKSPYPRISAVFFTPVDAQKHVQIYGAMLRQPNFNDVFNRASKEASIGNHFNITPEQCRRAFDVRYELLKNAATNNYGLVDVIELI